MGGAVRIGLYDHMVAKTGCMMLAGKRYLPPLSQMSWQI